MSGKYYGTDVDKCKIFELFLYSYRVFFVFEVHSIQFCLVTIDLMRFNVIFICQGLQRKSFNGGVFHLDELSHYGVILGIFGFNFFQIYIQVIPAVELIILKDVTK